MKTCISSYSFNRLTRSGEMTIFDVIDFVADLDSRGIEFVVNTIGLDDGADPIKHAHKLRKRCDKRKLAIASYTVGANFLQPTERTRRAEIRRVKGQIDIGAALGVRTMRHDATGGFPDGWKGSKTFAHALKYLVPAIREIADYARQFKITTTTENHGRFVQHSRRVEKLIRAVDRKNYAATVDIGNFLCVDENPVGAVRRMAPYARLVHAKDFHVKPAGADPGEGWGRNTGGGRFIRGAILGHGSMDVPQCLEILYRSGYRGYCSLEFEGMEDPRTGVRIGFENMTRYLKAIGKK